MGISSADCYAPVRAGVAQLVEQRFCKAKVVGSIPSAGSKTALNPGLTQPLDKISAIS
jgi:hypothetical protein